MMTKQLKVSRLIEGGHPIIRYELGGESFDMHPSQAVRHAQDVLQLALHEPKLNEEVHHE